MILLLLPAALAGAITHTDEADFAAGEHDNTLATSDGAVTVEHAAGDNGEWYDAGGGYAQLQKDDGTWFSAKECPAQIFADAATYNGVPFRMGPYAIDGKVAGIPTGVAIEPPSGGNYLDAVHLLHPGGRCTAQTHTFTWTYADGSTWADTYSNTHDCSLSGSSGAWYAITPLANYGEYTCCSNWYEAAFTNPYPERLVESFSLAYNDGCGGTYLGQVWAVTAELAADDYADWQAGGSEGVFTSAALDAGSDAANWTGIAWTEDLAPGDALTLAVRAGDTPAPDGTWGEWSEELSGGSGALTGVTGRYAQYRATFLAGDGASALEDVTLLYEEDGDGDGYYADDCDDGDAGVNPGASEVCGGGDEDCDGSTDEGDAADAATWYEDDDGDGYGDDARSAAACAQPPGTSAVGGDCSDTSSAINPGATEVCDTRDNDCDGTSDEDSAADAATFYADDDGDKHGDPAATAVGCDAPAGYVVSGDDCDDLDAAVYPGAGEVCDGADQDCDGAADDSAIDAATWYADADADGYGDPASTAEACDAPAGYVSGSSDCLDSDPGTHPGAPEICDFGDNDCDGAADEGLGSSTYYADADGDGYGDPGSTIVACAPPEGYVANDDDCDDADAASHPGGTEAPGDGADGDCDGLELCFKDEDGDGYRPDDGETIYADDASCAGAGEASAATPAGDCDDEDPAFNPGAEEFCDDPTDYNCDGSVQYADEDGDGWAACEECDDGEEVVNPAAPEICDGLDNDCDGEADGDAAIDPQTYYADADGDGFADQGATMVGCEPDEGYIPASAGWDCDDADPGAHPGAVDQAGDGIDQDCDGADLAGEDGGEEGGKDGCGGCSGAGSAGGWAGALVGLLALARRRRR